MPTQKFYTKIDRHKQANTTVLHKQISPRKPTQQFYEKIATGTEVPGITTKENEKERSRDYNDFSRHTTMTTWFYTSYSQNRKNRKKLKDQKTMWNNTL